MAAPGRSALPGAWPSLIGCALLIGALAVPAAAQAPVYTAAALRCGRFSESVRGHFVSSFGLERRTELLGRDGILEVRADGDSAGAALEMWYDTLAVFREGPHGRDTPATAGILGGRYRGLLSPDGHYRADRAPFVPAAMRDIFDFTRIPLHLFPPLPAAPLAPDRTWTDSAGLTVRRLADSAGFTGPVRRYRWTRQRDWAEGLALGDSTVVVRRNEVEEGAVAWRVGEGPLGWSSAVTAGIEWPGGAGRSTLTQETRVRRLSGACP